MLRGIEGICIFAVILFSLLATFNLEAADVSAQELLEHPQRYDAKFVAYKGEVVGDIMIRGEFAWINVRDENAAVGVFCPRQQAEAISQEGNYQFSGDIVLVRGTFYRSCPIHGGEADIHADRITVIQRGKPLSHHIEPGKLKATFVLAIIAFVLAITHLITRRWR